MDMEQIAETSITRYRCDGIDKVDPEYQTLPPHRKHLLRESDLINLRMPDNGRRDYVVTDGPCPVCGAGWQRSALGSLGPAGCGGTYRIVGVKATLMPKVRCDPRCMNATSFDCKCSCGGERHGLARES